SRGSALGRVAPDKQLRLGGGDREALGLGRGSGRQRGAPARVADPAVLGGGRAASEGCGLAGSSDEQRIALDLLLDPEIGIVSLGGRAGTGKSALAMCAGLESVMECRAHMIVVVFRRLHV